ncbi:MAG: hypothetical protein AB4352_10695 [Hormoscilla sp.]
MSIDISSLLERSPESGWQMIGRAIGIGARCKFNQTDESLSQ